VVGRLRDQEPGQGPGLHYEGDCQRLGPGRPREVHHGQRGVAPYLLTSRYARPDGQEGFPQPRPRYRAARNRVTAMVRRDKEASNLAKLAESVCYGR
jgi:hypothetical protein